MKLISHVTLRLSVAITVIMSVWAVLFYLAMIDEINDEVDDALEDYSETIIIRALSGERLPSKNNGSNNQYYLLEVDAPYARTHPSIAYSDEMVYIEEKRETEPARVLRTIFTDNDDRHFMLVVMTPTIEKHDLKHSIFIWMSILYLTLLVIIIMVNIIVFYRSMKPLYRLLQWLRSYRVGQRNEPLANSSSPERPPAPVARCMAGASVLSDIRVGKLVYHLPFYRQIQLEELAKTHQTLEHITKLNKSLLLLSKIENEQFPEVSPVCLNDILQRYLEDYEEVYDYRDISVEIREECRLTFVMNEMLATTLVTNLLKNAFVHNTDGGRIVVTFAADRFTIGNTGVDTPLDATRIFEPFYKGSKQEGSTGLGLSIADGICKLSGLTISYAHRDGMHCFTITRRTTPSHKA